MTTLKILKNYHKILSQWRLEKAKSFHTKYSCISFQLTIYLPMKFSDYKPILIMVKYPATVLQDKLICKILVIVYTVCF